ncbi:hypothetical protein KSC_002770 [Ktedonobacter sp. SOSP1-52]|uniref:hypothetical protein n=1 Tax=Ktedonobacter sp. SOSP1-52 TaxID=2778366 RepID=UPI001916A412|nr:hypothetical protein [Ktedonobacter sp. SOSP1-52]GHO61385.1 hypothetical protein KSC_002770 [Ktedonobacter sp. SOSP1-52]
MTDNLWIALIGVSGVVIGAILSFLASALNARQKIKEIKLTYQQKLDESYVTSARIYIDDVYMPINIALSILESQYYDFKMLASLYKENDNEYAGAREVFQKACEEFTLQIGGIFQQGKDAYIISELDQNLRSFNNFIKHSKDAKKYSAVLISRLSIKFLNLDWEFKQKVEEEVMDKDEKKLLQYFKYMRSIQSGLLFKITVKYLLLFSFAYDVDILAAPVNSLAFEQRLSSEVPDLKAIIKKVTLGVSTI